MPLRKIAPIINEIAFAGFSKIQEDRERVASYLEKAFRFLSMIGLPIFVMVFAMMFALIAEDQLYLKVDDGNRAAYEAAGLEPFTYSGKGAPVRMSYHAAPGEGFDDPEVLCAWAREAYAAALRARAAARPRRAARRRG